MPAHDDGPHPRQQRGNFLALAMTALLGGCFLIFLIIASGGFIFYVLAVVGLMAAVGFLHYVLWGQSLTQQVAAEKEEEEIRERQEAGGEYLGDKIRSRRF